MNNLVYDNPLNIQGHVLLGHDGELYLAGGNHAVIRFANGEFKVKAESIQNFRKNIDQRRQISEVMGVKFMQLVAPEKYRVLSGSFPLKSPTSLVDQYLEGGSLALTDPVAQLRGEKSGRTYFQTDTHWAVMGRAVIARMIAEAAGKSLSSVAASDQALRSSIVSSEKNFIGDLGRKLNPPLGEYVQELVVPHQVKTVENGIGHDYERPVNEGRLVLSLSDAPTADGTLLIFGDSYLHQALNCLSFYYSKVVFCRTRFFHSEMVHMVRPDIVVSQIAERYLGFVYPDDIAPPFLLLPYVMGRAPDISPDAAKALSMALAAGREPSFTLFDALAAPRNGSA